MYMLKAEWIPVLLVSSLLFIYVALVFWGKASFFTAIIFSLSPIFVIGLVYSVIRHGEYKDRELKTDEEFGYADKL